MASQEENLKSFAIKLFNINAIKFGEFKTKVGLMTPVYCDLRIMVSYPDVMKSLAELLIHQIKGIDVDVLCGVPYTALPIATVVSLLTSIPMVMRRQEPKYHGTKKVVDGVFKLGDRCLIIEDVVTSGSSILETARDLQNEGLKCTDAFVFLNREQGGAEILKEKGITMHPLMTLSQLVDYLHEATCIDREMVEKVKLYIRDNQVTGNFKPVA